MEKVKVTLAYLSEEELQKAVAEGKAVRIGDVLQKRIADTFYGGYFSGSTPMGHTPNCVILSE